MSLSGLSNNPAKSKQNIKELRRNERVWELHNEMERTMNGRFVFCYAYASAYKCLYAFRLLFQN